MANRRCLQTLVSRYLSPISHFPNSFIHPIAGTLSPLFLQTQSNCHTLTPTESPVSTSPESRCPFPSFPRYFCSDNRINDNNDDDEADDDDETEEEEEGQSEEDVGVRNVSGKSDEEKAKEAEEIGYKVVGPLQGSDRLFKPYETVFAVVQIGSHQFKVSNGDSIFVEKLKNCDVNDKLILNRILMLGSKAQTIIGRPILPDAAVHAVVEEHALDAKVIIFKKKRRKNYRRTKGHRQELTKLRITDIQGIEKPETTSAMKIEKKAQKVERTAVPA